MQIAICFLGRKQGAPFCIAFSPDCSVLLDLSQSVQGLFEGLSGAREQNMETTDFGWKLMLLSLDFDYP